MAAPPPPTNTTTTTSQPPPSFSFPPQHQQRTLRIGTRSSALALAQVSLFTTLLSSSAPHLPTSTHPTTTSLGDTNKTTSLHALASTGKSLWTEDLERDLASHAVDVIIHSMKDVPTQLPRGLACVAVGGREESRDAVVLNPRGVREGWRGLGDLPRGGTVGTSSVRRAAMIRRRYPHLLIKDIRGNVPTRLRKLDFSPHPHEGYDALVLAGAGVQRLGLGDRVSSWLGREEGMLHAVGQGALGVEWREGDEWVEGVLEGLGRGKKERRVRWECVVERGLLRALEGGCSVPVGVDCEWEEEGGEEEGRKRSADQSASPPALSPQPTPPDPSSDHLHGGKLTLRAMVVSLDGTQCVEGHKRHFVNSDSTAEEAAWQMYRELVEKGAERILNEIRLNRDMIEGLDNA